MHVLFIHRTFPAQFRYVAPRLPAGWDCTFVTQDVGSADLASVKRIAYRPAAINATHPYTTRFSSTASHALGVYEALRSRGDVRPDLIVAHGSFGSTLFLPYLYDAPIINFFEYFYRPVGQDLGYRPDQAVTEQSLLRCAASNAMTLLDLENCDRAWCPTRHQRSLMPTAYQGKVEVVHDGIDTDLFRRDGAAARRLPDGTAVPEGTQVVTYVARGFEMARGFDVFMRAARRVCEMLPNVVFVVAGEDRVFYGSASQRGAHGTFRERVLAEGHYDLSRFRFVGKLPQASLAQLLSVSDLHVYLTVPFFTSWSPLEAMSSGCVLLASDTDCTREYLTHGRNGLICDFFDEEGLARQAVEVLKDPRAYRHLGAAARETIEREYSINATYPRIRAMFEGVAAKGPRTPSVRAERLVRAAGLMPGERPHRSGATAPGAPGVVVSSGLPYEGAIPFRADGGSDATTRPSRNRLRAPSASPPALTAATGVAGAARKTVLFCWELGGGLGHLMQLLPLAAGLAEKGHRVYVALRLLDRAAADLFGRAGVSFLPVPVAPLRTPRATSLTYAQVLGTVGFADGPELFARACAWRNLIRFVRPDLIVFDHAPTALLASLGFPAARAVIGSGFCVPPDHDGRSLWGGLRPDAPDAEQNRARTAEADVLDRVNWVLANWKQPAIERLGRLYSEVDETFLATFPELDHFRTRPSTTGYWGPVLGAHAGDGAGEAPAWPIAGGAKRVFAYLKAAPSAVDVLRALDEAGCRTIAYVDGATAALRRRVESSNLHLSEKRVDVARAAAECDLAALNGGHGVTCQMLLAGKPTLFVPLNLEQQMTADAVTRMGAGESSPGRKGQPWQGVAKLEGMMSDERYAAAARHFADRYAAFDPARQRAAMLRRAEELLAGESLPGDPPAVTREAELAAV